MPASTVSSSTDAWFVRPALVAAVLSGCGYVPLAKSVGGKPTPVFIEPSRPRPRTFASEARALGVDRRVAGVEVDAALGAAVARSPRLSLAARDRAAITLRVWIEAAERRLTALSEPSLRGATYEAVVRLQGEVRALDGELRWRGLHEGTATYLSTPGAIETLDGADRRALAQAARVAAQRLTQALTAHLAARR